MAHQVLDAFSVLRLAVSRSDFDIAARSAVQTAVIAVVVEELISSNSIDRNSLTNRLYDLLSKFDASGGEFHHAGAIRHLIALIENPHP